MWSGLCCKRCLEKRHTAKNCTSKAKCKVTARTGISQEEKEEAKAQEKKFKRKEEALPHVSDLLEAFMRYESLGIEQPRLTREKQFASEKEFALKSIRDSLVFEKYHILQAPPKAGRQL